ncbi:hypothetical protein RBB50_003508 [Rhinocladiella similis]
MSGKRIIDAIALLNASRNVAVKHFDIRFSQAKLYGQTSSVVKALRNRALPALATSVSRFASSQPPSRPPKEGLNQDHFYERSEQNSPAQTAANGDLDVQQAQAKRSPLPDGTIPPDGSPIGQETGDGMSFNKRPAGETPQHPVEGGGAHDLHPESLAQSTIPDPTSRQPLSPDEARRLQRQSEDQIPARAAEPPTGEETEFGVEQEQDVFYQPPDTVKPVLSALPRVKVPKSENDVQGGDSHIPPGINADVYYSGSKPQHGTVDNEPNEEQLSQLFHNPRHATTLLRQKSNPLPSSKRRFHNSRPSPQKASDTDEDNIKQLAADMAKDAQRIKTSLPVANVQPYQMRESRIPSSRIGRIFEYGGLAASMAFGAVSESISRSGGPQGSIMLSAGNMKRLVAKLSKMRGAALKLGQMMSFQDAKLLPKPIHDVLQRVQDSADYMPASQRDAVISADLGRNWRDLFEQFEERPMAAASIGQVHGAVMRNSGKKVAVKVQYPGVAESISSDLNNLSLLLTASRLLPKGLYLDKTIANARTELGWECDYEREAEAAKRFRELLADETTVFTVPEVFDEASGKRVLTMELMEGVAVTKIQTFTQEQKDWIGSQILRLCLREIIEFKYMQTDPNWTNFLYNAHTNKLELLDFGASREYPAQFIDLYVKVLDAASRKDRNSCRDLSIKLGYLTGYESRAMLNAHIDSVMTLAEPFMNSAPDVYDFQDQTITDRVRDLIPIMLRERLAPPPEETYSLHRKLSGAFLLCARLGSRVRCKDMFHKALVKAGVR